MTAYCNPVIPGFHPDPSICRVGDDYYLVTSTFEYFPGLPVFHSQDLVHWRQIGHAVSNSAYLDLSTAWSMGGLYAPTIRYHAGWFYVACTNVSAGGQFIVKTQDPAGAWSAPIWIERGGIDPSLFFDDDGTVYYTRHSHEGILQAVIDPATGALKTPLKIISGSMVGKFPEGPHLYKIGGMYYLMVAEGGTEYGHDVPIAKHHGSARLTLGMKNMMGLVRNRSAMHGNLGQSIADLNTLIKPKLTVVDAVRILMENGPSGGDLNDVKQLDTIVASADIVAADSYAASFFGMQPDNIPYIKNGAAMGLGRSDLASLKIEEISVGG